MSVLVYGGGVPALAAALALVERGLAVVLVGPTEAARCPHLPVGGLIATDVELERWGTAGAACVEELGGFGVPFHRDGGELALRRLPGWDEPVAAHVGGRTAAVTAWALDRQLGRQARDGADVQRAVDKELEELVVVDGRVVGAVLRDRWSGALEGLSAEAVILATSGRPGVLEGSTASTFPERAVAAAFRAGAKLSGSGQPRLSPTLLAHGRRAQPLSSALRAEGARLWVPVDDKEARLPRDIPPGDRDHFVEASLGDDAAFTADQRVAELVAEVTAERGIWDRRERANRGTAYLDISHLPEGHLRPLLGDELDAIAARVPRSPFAGPVEVRAGAVSLGAGLRVNEEQATSLPGLWAAGDAVAQDDPRGGVALIAQLEGARRAAQAVTTDAADDEAVERARLALEAAPDERDDAARDTLADAFEGLAFDEELALDELVDDDRVVQDGLLLARAVAQLKGELEELTAAEVEA